MPYVLWFDKLGKDSLALAGGKGSNLAEIANLKLPVPPGFVITTQAFDRFLEANKINKEIEQIIANTDVQDTNALTAASDKIKRLIVSSEIPLPIRNEMVDAYKNLSYTSDISLDALKLIASGRDFALVAVRSSATAEDLPTASFAGQQKTFLNVKGIGSYLTAVKNSWASLFEPRAIYYRNVHQVASSSIALVVQRMVNSEKAGVVFTVNPATGEENIVIEATWGFGENLVSGEIEPDTYILSRDGSILEKRIGRKEKMRIRDYSDRTVDIKVPADKMSAQVLTEDEMKQLVNYGLTIEQHYGKHQDIEFAIEKGKVYIVQTRAVTTQAKKEIGVTEGNVLISGLGSSPGVATGTVKIVRTNADLAKIEKGDVLVTKMTSPDMVVAMGRSVAIVTDEGGMTAHASIVGREMGLPVIVGTKEATQKLQDGQKITVDAFSGKVFEGEIAVQKPVEQVYTETAADEFMVTSLKVNLVFADRVEEIAKKVDGVGLLRIEHMIAKNGIHPAKFIREGRSEDYIKILMEGIRPIAKAFSPKPVWVRTLDARSDEFRNLEGGEQEEQEANPMLGWHGIRRSLDEPEILKAELTAIKRLHEEGLTNILVMFPFIIAAEELKKAKQIASEVGFNGKYGIMVETPAAALTIGDFCQEGISFASFGSNDMTQLVLGIDRGNTKIQNLYSEKHAAMKKIFQYVIDVCKEYNVESSICGEGPSNDQELVEFLINSGIDSISVNMDAIDKVRNTIIKTERKLLLEAVRKRKL